MQLTIFTDYVLRTVLYLGCHGGRVVPVSEISDAHRISREHVSKAAKWLTQRGYVKASRGQAGGLQLAVPLADIRLGELVRKSEPHLDLLECFDAEANACRLSPACRLKGALEEAKRAFLAVLDGYSMADLASNAPELLVLLRVRRR
jgi:Rrf2 family nitric oxide-sensitive transcriptional repressor